MKKIFWIGLIAVASTSYCQEKVSIGITGAYTNDFFNPVDPSRSLIEMPLPSGSFGFTIRKEMTVRFFVETGLASKYYWEGIRFSQISSIWSSSDAFHSILLPISLGYNFPLARGYSLAPVGSLVSAIKTDPLFPSRGSGSRSNSSQSITYSYLQKEFSNPFFFMAELRLALEKKIGNSFRLAFYHSRTFGFNTANEINVQYAINGTPYEGRYTSKGDYWSVGVGIAYILKPKTKTE